MRGCLRAGGKKGETIASQTAALRAHAERLGLEVPDEWVFEDEGHSGATLIRPALERLRDVVAGVGIDVVLCYSPDRLARKFAYQALLIEEFARAGTGVEFVKGPRGDSPDDQRLVGVPGHVRRVREGPNPGALPAGQGPPLPRLGRSTCSRVLNTPTTPTRRVSIPDIALGA
jgi:Resolvase, N terminal domain